MYEWFLQVGKPTLRMGCSCVVTIEGSVGDSLYLFNLTTKCLKFVPRSVPPSKWTQEQRSGHCKVNAVGRGINQVSQIQVLRIF